MKEKFSTIEAIKEIRGALAESQKLLDAAIIELEKNGTKEVPNGNESSARDGLMLIGRYAWKIHDAVITPNLALIAKDSNRKKTSQRTLEEATQKIDQKKKTGDSKETKK